MNATTLAQGRGQRATNPTSSGAGGLRNPTPQVPRKATTKEPRAQRGSNPSDTGPADVTDPTSQASRNEETRNEPLIGCNDANSVPTNAVVRAPANLPVHEERTQEFNNDPRLSVAEPFVSVRKACALNKALGWKGKEKKRQKERAADRG